MNHNQVAFVQTAGYHTYLIYNLRKTNKNKCLLLSNILAESVEKIKLSILKV